MICIPKESLDHTCSFQHMFRTNVCMLMKCGYFLKNIFINLNFLFFLKKLNSFLQNYFFKMFLDCFNIHKLKINLKIKKILF